MLGNMSMWRRRRTSNYIGRGNKKTAMNWQSSKEMTRKDKINEK